MGLVQTRPDRSRNLKPVTMDLETPCRITRAVPLIRLEPFCRSLQDSLRVAEASADLERLWRLYISAECPRCGIQVAGPELRALALPPCAELATAKIGRMRLGYCARQGCEACHYSVHFWNQQEFQWPGLLDAAEHSLAETAATKSNPANAWRIGLASVTRNFVLRATALMTGLLMMWLAYELYRGGPIPLLRPPETFAADPTPLDPGWPAPKDGSEGPMTH